MEIIGKINKKNAKPRTIGILIRHYLVVSCKHDAVSLKNIEKTQKIQEFL